jgi:hypothetical protein
MVLFMPVMALVLSDTSRFDTMCPAPCALADALRAHAHSSPPDADEDAAPPVPGATRGNGGKGKGG